MQAPCRNYIIDSACEKGFHFPTKTENQLNNVVIFDLETFKRDGATTFTVIFYPGSRIMEKVDRDFTNEELEKWESDTVVMKDNGCISQMFEYLKNYKGEPKWIKVKSKPLFGDSELKLFDQNVSSFDSWNILSILPTWCRKINPIKTASGLITVKIFKVICDMKENYRGKPQNIYVFFCSMKRSKKSIKNCYQHLAYKSFFKKEMDHEIMFGDMWEGLRDEWTP